MSGTGLFIARSFIPHAVKPCFDQFLVHPIAKLFKDAVLKNNTFSLKHRDNSIYNRIYNGQSMGTYYAGDGFPRTKTIMWWAKKFVERDPDNIDEWVSHYPLELEIRGNSVYKDDILLHGTLIDHTEDYIADGTYNVDMYEELDMRKKECNSALIGCVCLSSDSFTHVSSEDRRCWYWRLSTLLYTINCIINDGSLHPGHDYMRAIWHEYHSNFPYKTSMSDTVAAIKGTWSYVDEIYHIRKEIIAIINENYDYRSAKQLEDEYIKYSNDTRHFINRYDKIIYHL